MNTKYLAAVAAALAVGTVSPAFAGDCNGPGDDSCGTSSSQGQVQGQAQGQQQGQAQGQQQGQLQGQGQAQESTNVNVNVNANANKNKNVNKNENNAVSVSGSNSESAALAKNKNSQDVTINTFNPSDVTIRSAPGISIPGPASGPCNGASATFGLSLIGGGGGLGFSAVDQGCEERELARMLTLAGRNDLALDVLQNTEAYQRIQERKAAAAKKAEAEKTDQRAEARHNDRALAYRSNWMGAADQANHALSQ